MLAPLMRPPPPMPPALLFQAVGKTLRGRAVLEDVCLEVASGETFALAGVNGAGKTTLLRCALDFIRPSHGRLEIYGRSHLLPSARQPLAYLPERFLPPHYSTGGDFLRFVLNLDGRPFDEQEARAMLQALELDPSALRQPTRALSKGMTQKLGLAGCFLRRKPLLILDEPTSGLDPQARALFKQQVRAQQARGGTVLFTSHALADVEELADRMAILHNGSVRFLGRPAELRARVPGATLEQAFLEQIA